MASSRDKPRVGGTTPPPPTEAAMVAAYESVLPEMMALPDEALVPVNLDVTAAAGVAFGSFGA